MSGKKSSTLIAVSEESAQRLFELKKQRRETYDDVVRRLIDVYEQSVMED